MDEIVLPTADGIYFNLQDSVYHAIPRLSMSGIQNMMVSPATFWAQSWMNPAKKQDDDNSPARILGRAYHVARFEPDRFHETYVRDLMPEDMPERTLMTDAGIKAVLKDMELPQTKAGENVLERAARLIEEGFKGTIWHIERMMFEDDLAGRIPISGETYDQLIRDMELMQRVPEIARHLEGGISEVTVLWTCPQSGIPMKCRFDYLRPDEFVDMKTFENIKRKHVNQAITDAVKYNLYYIQAFGYWEATEIIRAKLVDIVGEASDEQRALIAAIRGREKRLQIWYIFQEKKGVPNMFAVRFMQMDVHPGSGFNEAGLEGEELEMARERMSSKTAFYHKAHQEITAAKMTFNLYKEVYDDDSEWFPLKPEIRLGDDSFSNYFLDEVITP